MNTTANVSPSSPATTTDVKPLSDQIVRTQHQIKVGSKVLKYTVDAGTIVLKEETAKDNKSEGEKIKATMSFMAYTLDGIKDRTTRPITFVFNGGPGSSSVWLHLGVFGPKRVAMADDSGMAPAPPFKLVDNTETLLDKSDLVFIDPVGTGFSRMQVGETTNEYHDFQRDLDAMAEFIRLYCSREKRWASPKYLAGESYGTTRAVGLAGLLQDKHGMYLNGLILISLALDFAHLRFDPGHDLPYPLYLPSYAATAWYHGRLEAPLLKKPLRKLLDEVEAFAVDEYLPALFKGRSLAASEVETLNAKLARYTGLSAEYIGRTRQRIELFRFCKELLRDEGKTVGRLDSRYQGYDRDSAGEAIESDPAMQVIHGAYATCLNQYLRSDLGVNPDLAYQILSPLYLSWSYKDFTNRYVSVADTLRKAMTTNSHLRVWVGNGYYDFATPHFASDYTFSHLAGPSELSERIEQHYFEAGHMMYVQRESREAMAKTIRAFVESAD
jgi:carboxypeptidase C (cathepsin A)